LHSIDLDKLDRRILDHLQAHGRATNLELAAVAGLSPAQCHRRHKRLEELGLVSGYYARLTPELLNLNVEAFIHIGMEKGHQRDLPKFLGLVQAMHQVQEFYSVTGDFDYMLKVVVQDLRALSVFLMDTLMRLPGVDSVRSSVCLDRLKWTTALPLQT